jgi:tRNA 2-thiocytidine biosynthesis protein TtcA
MIQDGDRILCGMSGGKDSFTMLHLLDYLRRRAPVRFELVAVTVDQGYRGFRIDTLERYFRERGYEYHIERTNIAGVIDDTMSLGDTHCSMCARLRRGVLYRLAPELKCNKIALGHHADDAIETLLMSQFFNGEICSMPPVLRSRDGLNTVIRPLCTVWEQDIRSFAAEAGFPVVCCACPACGDLSLKRTQMKALLRKLEADHAGIKVSLLRSLANVRAGHLFDRRWLPLTPPHGLAPESTRNRDDKKGATVLSNRHPVEDGQELPARRRERKAAAAARLSRLAANRAS